MLIEEPYTLGFRQRVSLLAIISTESSILELDSHYRELTCEIDSVLIISR